MTETFHPAFPGRPKPLLSHGLPFTTAVAQHAASTFGASRVYLIASASLARDTPHVANLQAALGTRLAGVRVGMRPHTHWGEILEMTAAARRAGADLLVTLGASSLTDAAKVIALCLANDVCTVAELEAAHPGSRTGGEEVRPPRVPVVCVPTSLSGAEYSATGGATHDGTGRKWSFAGPGVAPPALVVLDPALCAATPRHVWLSTGVKAVDHCVETLCSLASDEAADADAAAGLRRLIPGLLRCARGPERGGGDGDGEGTTGLDDARLQCQLGVVDAMSACSRGVPLGASHGIGHQLGPVGVSHGETSCVLLPPVCRYNYEKGANRERQDAVVGLLWEQPEAAGIFREKGLERGEAGLGDLMDAVIRALGMPRTLKEFGIGEDKLDGIAEHSLHDRWVKSNPAPLDKNGVLEILKMAME
ncbi:uncharacterized protein JN550_005622 [Neoarthrinium moseri]|uniref:uncharacterized protein n=1 Tax=Neoarthrinium moseri TaxID=1658444 RepID=UPI001FDD4210|nr:uncharacterized protein JN550_005622 [Neoarthrinium moseri]KAI1869641.1 hypothetical protein JN550_005622 [Neoarthrinium moseri]